MSEPANVLHCGGSSPTVAWSTINAGEAIPGVVTTLTWSVFGERTERGLRGAFADLGVLTESQVARPAHPDDRVWDIFHGRAAANLETFRSLADRMPGTSGDAMESQLFGTVRPGVSSRPRYQRYPVVAAKAPMAMWGVAGRLERAAEHIAPWWRNTIVAAPEMTADQARRSLDAAMRKFAGVMRPHIVAAMLCQGVYEQVRAAAERADRPGLEIAVLTGYGEMAETAFVGDLWDVSRGRIELSEFLARHGYHGPNEGELAARVWRLDPTPLEKLLGHYAGMAESAGPRALETTRAAEREAAERELLAASPRGARTPAGIVLKVARRFFPLRGVGKGAFLQCVDAARAAALRLGELHTEAGVLSAPEDVFHLTVEELAAPQLPAGVTDLVTARRELHERYRAIELPEFWLGSPEPVTAPPAAAEGPVVVTGIPVTPGVAAGVARVVRDPEVDEGPAPGEILVCRTTDPSWAAVLIVSAALVIDIGGPISHGAIVARELGIPCVIGTRDGTVRIADGDLIEVDGSAGTVTVLQAGDARGDGGSV
ncbi:PEP-utilizing enzyme [Sporichthya polymorpha]|uniref:PEP-utilizing enzyme n=1 Tax=Sporichthya polymorpha TaxID=35751 RepID=UPI0003636CBD|nr:PEP-utilizing enzyme [Sporichthya polymorpha]